MAREISRVSPLTCSLMYQPCNACCIRGTNRSNLNVCRTRYSISRMSSFFILSKIDTYESISKT